MRSCSRGATDFDHRRYNAPDSGLTILEFMVMLKVYTVSRIRVDDEIRRINKQGLLNSQFQCYLVLTLLRCKVAYMARAP